MADVTELNNIQYTFSDFDVDSVEKSLDGAAEQIFKQYASTHPNEMKDPMQRQKVEEAIKANVGKFQNILEDGLSSNDFKKKIERITEEADPRAAKEKMAAATRGIQDSNVRQEMRRISNEVRNLSGGKLKLVYGLETTYVGGQPRIKMRMAIAPQGTALRKETRVKALMDAPIMELDFDDGILNSGTKANQSYRGVGANGKQNLYSENMMRMRAFRQSLKKGYVQQRFGSYVGYSNQGREAEAVGALADIVSSLGSSHIPTPPTTKEDAIENAKSRSGSHKTMQSLSQAATENIYTLGYEILEMISGMGRHTLKGETPINLHQEKTRDRETRSFIERYVSNVMSKPVSQRKAALEKLATDLGNKYHISRANINLLKDTLTSYVPTESLTNANDRVTYTGRLPELSSRVYDPLGLADKTERATYQQANYAPLHKAKSNWGSRLKTHPFETKSMAKNRQGEHAYASTVYATSKDWADFLKKKGLTPEEMLLAGSLGEGAALISEDIAEDEYVDSGMIEFTAEQIADEQKKLARRRHKSKKKITREDIIKSLLKKHNPNFGEEATFTSTDIEGGGASVEYATPYHIANGSKILAQVPGGRQTAHIVKRDMMKEFLEYLNEKKGYNLSQAAIEHTTHISNLTDKAGMGELNFLGVGLLSAAHKYFVESDDIDPNDPNKRVAHTAQQSFEAFKGSIEDELQAAGLTKSQAQKISALYKIDDNGAIVTTGFQRFADVARDIARENSKATNAEALSPELKSGKKLAAIVGQRMLAGIGLYAQRTGLTGDRPFEMKNGKLIWNPSSTVTYGEIGAIDQALQDPREWGGGSDIKDSNRTIMSLVTSTRRASAAKNKDYSLLEAALQSTKKNTTLSEGQKSNKYANFEDTMAAFASGISVNDPNFVEITRSVWGDKTKGLDIRSQTEANKGLITKELLENSVIGSIMQSVGAGRRGYLDVNGRKIVLPNMDDLQFETRNGENVLSGNVEWLEPLVHMIGSLRSSKNPSAESYESTVTKYKEDWAQNLYSKDRAMFDDTMKYYGGATSYLKVIGLLKEAYGADGANPEKMELLKNAGVMNLKNLADLLATAPENMTQDEHLEGLLRLLKTQMADVSNEEAQQAYKELLGSKEGATTKKAKKSLISKAAEMLARTADISGKDIFSTGKGLAGLDVLRFPENLGMLSQFARVFVSGDNSLAPGTIGLGPALQEWEHADFDGDKMIARIKSLTETIGLVGPELDEFFKQLYEVLDFEEEARKFVGKKKLGDSLGDADKAIAARAAGVEVPIDDILTLTEEDQATINEITSLMKSNKARTGRTSLANFNVEHFRNNVADYGKDMTEEEWETAIAGDVLNVLTSNVSQFGISAKKIFRNVKGNKKYIKEGHITDALRADLESFFSMYEDEAVWNNDASRAKMLKLGAKLGVFGGNPTDENSGLFDAGRTSKMLTGSFISTLEGHAKNAGKDDDWVNSIIRSTFGIKNDEAGNELIKGLRAGTQDLGVDQVITALRKFNDFIKAAPEGYRSVTSESGHVYHIKGTGDLINSKTHLVAGSPAEANYNAEAMSGRSVDATEGQGAFGDLIEASSLLKEAAEALISVAGRGGFGGGSGGVSIGYRPPKEVLKDLDSMAKGKAPYLSVSDLIRFISPFGEGTNDNAFKLNMLAGAHGGAATNYGYDADTFAKLRKGYMAHEQGTVGGILAQMHNYDGSDVWGESPEAALEAFRELYGKKGGDQKKTAFADLNTALKSARGLGLSMTAEQFLSDPTAAVQQLAQFFQGINPENLKANGARNYQSLARMFERGGGFFGYATGMAGMARASNGGSDIERMFMRTARQNQLSDAHMGGMKYYGGERELKGLIGNLPVHGFLDNLHWDEASESWVAMDNKNTGKVSIANLAQQILYKYLGEQRRSAIQGSGAKTYAEFAADHQELAEQWGPMSEDEYQKWMRSKAFITGTSHVGNTGEGSIMQINAKGQILDNAVAAILKTFNELGSGTVTLEKALRSLFEVMTGTGEMFSGATKDELEGMLKNDLVAAREERQAQLEASGSEGNKDDLREYRNLAKQRSAYLKQMMGDQRRSDLSIYSSERDEIEALNVERAEEIKLIDERMEEIEKSGTVNQKNLDTIKQTQARVDQLNELAINAKNKGALNLWDSLRNQVQGLFYHFTQMGGVYRVLGKIRQGIAKVVQAATQLDKVMTNLRIVTGYSAEDANVLMSNYTKLAKTLSSTTVEAATAAQEWLRQGYEVSQVNDLVASSIQLSVLGMMSATDATKALTSAMKGFKMETAEVSSIVDKFTALDMKAATSAGDIATALSKFATTAQMAGMNIDQAAAMATTIMDVSQSDAGSTGNAIKTILSRYGNVKAGVFSSIGLGESDDTTEKINDIEKVLNVIGVRIRDSAHEMRDFDDVLADIAEKWDLLDKVSQNAIATALAGTRQREAFAVLMNNYDKYQELLEVSENSEGTAVKKYQSYTEQLEASQKRLQTAWEEFARSESIAKFLKGVNNILTFAVEKLPIIIKYMARLVALTNAYKLPSLFASLTPKGGISGAASGMAGFIKGMTPSGYAQKVRAYEQNDSGTMLSRMFKKFGLELDNATKSLRTFSGAAKQGAKKGSGVPDDGKNKEKDKGAVKKSQKDSGSSVPSADAQEPLQPIGFFDYRKQLRDLKGQAQDQEASINAKYDASRDAVSAQYNTGMRDDSYYDDLYAGDSFATMIDTSQNERLAQIEKERQEALKAARAENEKKQEALRQRRQASKVSKGQRATSVAVGAVSGFMTANTTGRDLRTGETFEASEDAAGLAKVTTGAATAIGSIWGPLVGMLAGTAADLLNKYLLIPLMDFRKRAEKQVMDAAQKVYDGITSLKDDVATLDKLSLASEMTAEEYKEMRQTIDDFLGKVYKEENASMRHMLENELNRLLYGIDGTTQTTHSLYSIMNEYMESDKDTKRRIALALEAAQLKIEADSKLTTYQSKISELNEKTNRKVIGWRADYMNERGGGMGSQHTNNILGGGASLYDLYKKAGFKFVDTDKNFWEHLGSGFLTFITGIRATYSKEALDTSNMDLNEQLERFESLREETLQKIAELESKGEEVGQDLRNLVNSTDAIIEEIGEIKAIQESIYREYNNAAVAVAYTGAKIGDKYLVDATTRTLKNMGIEEIREVIAQQLTENGGLMGHSVYDSNGKITDYAKSVIDSYLKSSTEVSKILNGQAYSIRDIAAMDDSREKKDQYVKSFAAALNMSVEEFKRQLQDSQSAIFQNFGWMTLEDLLETTAETRSHITDLVSLFESLASATGLTAENIETIIDKFPQLAKYLGDASSMAVAMIQNLDDYKKSYAIKTYNSMASNEGVFNQYETDVMSQLTPEEREALNGNSIFGNAATINDILRLISTSNPSMYGITENIQKVLRSEYDKLFSGIDTDSIVDREMSTMLSSYLQKHYEEQIDNLNEQKTALQEINKQREYELKLIEAKQRLEEAGEQKKRIWREGVGWVYESDQNALAEAEKNLEDVERMKVIDDLQLQIDYLEAEKDYLASIPSRQEMENLKMVYDSWLASDAKVYDMYKDWVLSNETYSTAYADWLASNEEYHGLYTEWLANNQEYYDLYSQWKTETGDTATTYEEWLANNADLVTSYEEWVAQNEDVLGTFGKWVSANAGYVTSFETWIATNREVLGSQIGIIGQIADLYSKLPVSGSQGSVGEVAQTGLTADDENALKAEEASKGLGPAWDKLQKAKDDMSKLETWDDGYKEAEEAYNAALQEYLQVVQDSAGSYGAATFFDGNAKATEAKGWEEKHDYIPDIMINGETYHIRPTNKLAGSDTFRNIQDDFAYGHADSHKGGPGYWWSAEEVEKGNAGKTAGRQEIQDEDFREDFGGSLSSWLTQKKVQGAVVAGGSDDWGYVLNNELVGLAKAARGSLGLPGGLALLNELGTEAIITPQGTVTALPSGTGVVPADITKNLWSLGKSAPALESMLDRLYHRDQTIGRDREGTGGFNIGVFNMNVTPGNGFDIDEWIQQVRAAVQAKNGSR